MIKRACLAGAIAFIATAPLMPSAHAQATIVNVGWWSQRPGASELPSGSFELALGPTDELSRAALRIRVDAPFLSSALLELTESDAAGAEVAAVLACPAAENWAPANPGAWDDAPAANCNRNISMSRRSTGEWVGDISGLLGSGTTAIALVPMSHADTRGVPVPYRIVFSKATLQASAPEDTPPPPPPPTFDDLAPPETQPDEVEQPETQPSTDVAPSTPAPSVAPAADGDANEGFDPPLAADDDSGPPKPWWRVAILIPVAALLGAGAVFGRRLASERGLLG